MRLAISKNEDRDSTRALPGIKFGRDDFGNRTREGRRHRARPQALRGGSEEGRPLQLTKQFFKLFIKSMHLSAYLASYRLILLPERK
jgi:hypothetical protein